MPAVLGRMIFFPVGTGRFMLRTAGVVFQDRRVLLHQVEGWDFWALPGGRVRHLETSEQAVKREMLEETKSPIEIERLLWVVENFFQHEEGSGPTHPLFLTPSHELGFYYLCRFPEHSPLYEQETFLGEENGHTLIFKWFPFTALEECPLYPAFLRKALQSPPANTTHVCVREGNLAQPPHEP
ncbi:MAG: NUDIX hydrolase [Candidatus Hermodarchaeota archaeon]|nr:NUDIX hydrolase [Candidatus Hermodarchaeota archaeon]